MKKIIIGSLVLAMPLIAAAKTITELFDQVKTLLDAFIPVLMMIAVAIFLYGVVRYIFSAGDEEARKTSKNYIIYGLIGLFVMVAFWGIIELVRSTFSLGETPIAPPKIR